MASEGAVEPQPKLRSDEVPQANRLERVVERVLELRNGRGPAHARDGHYYAQAARVLGLLDAAAQLTPRGRALAEASEHDRAALLVQAFASSAVGSQWAAFARVDQVGAVPPESAEAFLLARSELSESTARRRASTLRFWWHALFLPPRDAALPAPSAIAGMPASTHALFEQLLREPLLSPPALLAEVDRHVAAFAEGARTNEFIDWEEARDLAAGLHALHARLGADDTVGRRLWQAAARYFLVVEDADSDFDIGGLDDDLSIFNAVARHLGHDDLAVQVP